MDYNKLFYIFLFGLIFSFAISPLIINALYKYKVWKRKEYIQNIENQAKKKNTPIMGGLIFVIGTLVITFLFNRNREYTYIPMAVIAISSTLGFTDDLISIFGRGRTIRTLKDTAAIISGHNNIIYKFIHIILIPWRLYSSLFVGFNSGDGKELFPHERIFVYFITAGIVAWWFYYKISWPDKDILWLPFNLSITIGVLVIPFIILLIIGTTTAVAITDGLDGLLASLAITSFVSLGVIAYIQSSFYLAVFCATMVGSLFAYLYFNIKPARIWMGDTGAVALGATMATVAVLLNRPILIFVLGLLYFIDLGSSFIQVYGVKVFHKKLLPIAPIHHWFEKLGWDESKIVIRATILSWVLGVIAIWLSTQ